MPKIPLLTRLRSTADDHIREARARLDGLPVTIWAQARLKFFTDQPLECALWIAVGFGVGLIL